MLTKFEAEYWSMECTNFKTKNVATANLECDKNNKLRTFYFNHFFRLNQINGTIKPRSSKRIT
jgi:hypothetical protein